MINQNLQESPIIYLAPDLANHISFFMWDISNREQFVLQTIPWNIYRYLQTCNMEIFEKLTPKFKDLAKKRYTFHVLVSQASMITLLHTFVGGWVASTHVCTSLNSPYHSPQTHTYMGYYRIWCEQGNGTHYTGNAIWFSDIVPIAKDFVPWKCFSTFQKINSELARGSPCRGVLARLPFPKHTWHDPNTMISFFYLFDYSDFQTTVLSA